MLFYLICLLLIFAILGLPYLGYLIPKNRGYPKTGKVIGCLIAISILILLVFIIFEDKLYSKSDAKKLLSTQGIYLQDKFTMSKLSGGRGDYYRTFTLQVSEQDKRKTIELIKSSANFTIISDSIKYSSFDYVDRHFGPAQIFNYENDSAFVREYYQPNGENYAPTFDRVSVNKKGNIFKIEKDVN